MLGGEEGADLVIFDIQGAHGIGAEHQDAVFVPLDLPCNPVSVVQIHCIIFLGLRATGDDTPKDETDDRTAGPGTFHKYLHPKDSS